MGTVSTSKQIADGKQRVAFIVPEVLVTAFDENAARAATDRSSMLRRLMFESLPADLRKRVKRELTQEHN